MRPDAAASSVARRLAARLGGTVLLAALALAAPSFAGGRSAAQAPPADPYVLVDAMGGTAQTIAALADGVVAAGIGARVAVLDVTTRTAPIVVGRTALLPAAPMDVAAAGRTAFAALGSGGLAVIDLTDRAAPRLAARLCLPHAAPGDALALSPPRPPASAAACADAGGPAVRAVGASEDGMTAFAVGGGGLLVVDASDPYRPREGGWLPLGVEGRAVATLALGGTVLVLGAVGAGPDAGNRIVVVDVGEPDRPALRSWLKLGGPSGAFVDLAAAGAVAVAGGTAGAAVVDLTRPDRPRVAARIDRFVSAVDVGTFEGRTMAVLASDALDDPRPHAIFDDIDLFDVSAPASPRRLGGHATATFVRPTGIVFGAMTAGQPTFVLASALAGCTVLERRETGKIVAVGEALSGGAVRVAADGSHAFVVEGDPRGQLARQRLSIVDLASGAEIGSMSGLLEVADMTVAGDRLYVVEGNQGVRIIGTANLAAPQTIGYIADVFTGRPPAIGPGWIAIVDTGNTVHVLDVRDPAQIRTLGAVAVSTDGPADIAVLDDRLLVAGADRLFAFDLSDPAQPVAIGQSLYDNDGAAFALPQLAVGDGRAWVVDVVSGLAAFDARPSLPRRSLRLPGVSGFDITAAGGRAIVLLNDGTLQRTTLAVVDAPPGGEAEVAAWTSPGAVGDMAPDPGSADGILVASGPYGLTRWRRRAEAVPTATPTVPAERPAPTRTARTAVPPDPARPHRAFLPLVTSGLAGAKPAVDVALVAQLGGVAGAAAADGDFAYVTSGASVGAYRLRIAAGARHDGPEALGSAWIGERILALAVTRGRLAALVGPPRALELVSVDLPQFGVAAGGGGGGQAEGASAIPPGDGTALRLLDVTDPARPRLAARVAVPPGAIDVAAGSDETGGWFAVVGWADAGGYFVMVDARDAAAPRATRLDLGDVRPVGVALAGRRAIVQLARAQESAALLVQLEPPDRPAPGGTLAGLLPATAAGGVAAAEDRWFMLTEGGVTVVDVAGRAPRLVSEAEFGFNRGAPAFVTAAGSNVWAGSRDGEIVQLFVFENSANVVSFFQLPYIDAVGLGRTLAVGNHVLVQAGGLLGSVAAAEVSTFDPDTGFDDDDGVTFEGVASGLGHSAAVAAGPSGSSVAFVTNANGSVSPVRTRPAGDEPMLGRAFSFLDNTLPFPPTGLALRGQIGVLVGGLTPLRSLEVLGELVAPVAEPPDTRTGAALDALGDSPTQRRVVLTDGFAWVAERNAGLAVFDVSDPSSPLRVGRMDTPGQPRGLAVRAGRVYMADGAAGLTLVDARNPASPREGGHLAAPGDVGAVALAADGRTAWITVDRADGTWLGSGRDRAAVWAVDVRDMTAPRVIGAAGLDMGRIADAVLDGTRLYVAGQRPSGGPMAEPAGGTLAVAVVDVADPARPVVAGQWTAASGFPYVPSMLNVVASRIVVALGEGGVAVLDVR